MDDLLNQFISFTRESLNVEVTEENRDAPVATLGLDSLEFIEVAACRAVRTITKHHSSRTAKRSGHLGLTA